MKTGDLANFSKKKSIFSRRWSRDHFSSVGAYTIKKMHFLFSFSICECRVPSACVCLWSITWRRQEILFLCVITSSWTQRKTQIAISPFLAACFPVCNSIFGSCTIAPFRQFVECTVCTALGLRQVCAKLQIAFEIRLGKRKYFLNWKRVIIAQRAMHVWTETKCCARI